MLRGKEINIEVCDDTRTSQRELDDDDYGSNNNAYSDSHYLMKRSRAEPMQREREEDSIRIQVLDDSPAIISPNVMSPNVLSPNIQSPPMHQQ